MKKILVSWVGPRLAHQYVYQIPCISRVEDRPLTLVYKNPKGGDVWDVGMDKTNIALSSYVFKSMLVLGVCFTISHRNSMWIYYFIPFIRWTPTALHPMTYPILFSLCPLTDDNNNFVFGINLI